MTRSSMRCSIVTAIVALAVTGCNESSLAPKPQLSTTYGAQLIECPANVERSTSAVVGPAGGYLSVDGHSLLVPAGAVLLPTTFSLTAPASNYMEIRVKANDQEGFAFLEPVTMTISYQRCTRSDIGKASLTIWKIDPATKSLLKHMGGTDDKAARRVTFVSDSLSGYSIAQ